MTDLLNGKQLAGDIVTPSSTHTDIPLGTGKISESIASDTAANMYLNKFFLLRNDLEV